MLLSKNEIGKLVKEARKLKSEKIGKRYTQIMLANDINKSQGYIGDIESGRTYPTYKVLIQIAEACDVHLSFFDPNNEYAELVTPSKNSTADTLKNFEITDIKTAMKLILSQPGLMLNGEMLSDESKIAIANAIQMGLAYAEKMQKKEE